MAYRQRVESSVVDLRTRILRTPGAADYVGLSASTLEKKRITGGGPTFIRLGSRAVGYDVRDLDAWLEQQRQSDSKSASDRSQG